MSPARRETILFWCQVGLFVTAMVTLLGILTLLTFFVVTHVTALDVDRARDKAMLQQHQTELAQHNEALIDHDRARDEASAAFSQMLADHQAQMRLLQQR